MQFLKQAIWWPSEACGKEAQSATKCLRKKTRHNTRTVCIFFLFSLKAQPSSPIDFLNSELHFINTKSTLQIQKEGLKPMYQNKQQQQQQQQQQQFPAVPAVPAIA